MNKILLVIQREYLERVRKKSFLIMSILGPLLIAAFYGLIIYFAVSDQAGNKNITVIDESGLFEGRLDKRDNVTFTYSSDPVDSAKAKMKKDGRFGVLYIPKFELAKPDGIIFYSDENPGVVLSDIERGIRDEVKEMKMDKSGVDKELLKSFETSVDIKAINSDNKESSVALAVGVGSVTGIMIYFFIFLYGTQVMRGVVVEKSSKVVEIIISSLKPFELMMGKIIGIAAVGFTQLLIWVVLSTGLTMGASAYFAGEIAHEDLEKIEQMQSSQMGGTDENAPSAANAFNEGMEKLKSLPLVKIGLSFAFYFIGGYLIYAALFALVGSAVDQEADAQQFMMPIILPLILSMAVFSPVIQNPDGALAFWMSMIPLTSPIVMMVRLPFGVPAWELAVSMILLVGGFVFFTWLAGRIYRIGILMHGTKVNWKTLGKWLFMKA